MDPRDLPEIKSDMIEFHRSLDPLMFYRMAGSSFDQIMAPQGRRMDGEMMDDLWHMHDETLSNASLFYVTSEMTEKILEASKTIPDFLPTHLDPPSIHGIIYMEGLEQTPWGEHGARSRSSAAFSWSCIGTSAGSLFSIGHLIDFSSGKSFRYKESMYNNIRAIGMIPPRMLPASLVPWQIGSAGKDEFYSSSEGEAARQGTMPLLKAAWMMLQQEELVDTSEVESSRGSAKRIRRSGNEPSKVRIVDINRRRYASHGREQYAREYDHRWKVRGHWRNQWYPSRGVHRPRWIEEHVRGPEDAPLIERDTVYRLR